MKGYIYKLYNDTLSYYGSSTMKIKERYWCHKSQYNSFIRHNTRKCESYLLFAESIDPKIEIVEEIEIENIRDKKLKRLEAEYIKNNECINKTIPLRTHKEYVEDNKEKISEYQKKYLKEYRLKNKLKLKEYGKERVICPCCLKNMSKRTFKYQHSKICYYHKVRIDQ